MTGTQISNMTPEATLPDGAVVPFVVPPGTVGFDPMSNYIYDLGADLLTRVSYTALAADTAAAQVGTASGDSVQVELDARPTSVTLAGSAGSSLVGFLQAGTGAQERTLQSKGRDVVSVLDFLGVLTVTAAFQAALATGFDVFVPRGNYTLTEILQTSAEGQRVYGAGASSVIVQSGTNANATCLLLAHDRSSVAGIHFQPNTTASSQVHGWGVAVTADYCIVESIWVSGMKRGGVLLSDANYCIVRGNIFFDSAVVPAPTLPQSETGCDVMALGTASYNLIEGNQCVSGCGVGVGCQTGTLGKSQLGNIIRGNKVKDQPVYGIFGYLSDIADRIDDMVVEGNTIEDISGQIFVNGGVNLFYGAGIYLQTVSRCIVNGNHIQRTNTDRSLPRSGSDSPAAIAITGRTNCVVSGNFIQDAFYGIQISQAANSESDKDGMTITGNVIRPDPTGTRKLIIGINLVSTYSTVVTGNDVVGSNTTDTTRGIFIVNSGITTQDMIISGNRVVTANNGIEMSGSLLRANVHGNIVRNCGFYGIYATALSSIVTGNDISGVVNGIALVASVTKGIIKDNLVSASGTAINDSSTNGASPSGNRISTGRAQGSAVLVAGTVTVNTTEVLAGDRVILSRGTAGGTLGDLSVGTITAATSFVINSNNAADTSTIFWRIEH